MAAELRHVYYDAEKTPWSVEGFWSHPQHRDYHKNWSGEYVILQEYGNFKNRIQLALVEEFDRDFQLAWEPLKVCAFCGFARMAPCTKRWPCPNLSDYRPEPDESPDAPAAIRSRSDDTPASDGEGDGK